MTVVLIKLHEASPGCLLPNNLAGLSGGSRIWRWGSSAPHGHEQLLTVPVISCFLLPRSPGSKSTRRGDQKPLLLAVHTFYQREY